MKMRFIYCLTLFLRLFLTATCVNHWILKENLILPKPESPFLMRKPEDLVPFLNQIRNSEYVENSYVQLLSNRELIVEHLQFSIQFGRDLVEQTKCAMEHYVLEKRSSYLKFSPIYVDRLNLPRIKSYKEINIGRNTEPNCEVFAPHLSSCFDKNDAALLESIDKISIDAEENMTLGDVKLDLDSLKRLSLELLQTQPSSWKSHLVASYYWRRLGEAKLALNCACRSVAIAPPMTKDMSLLSLGVILFRAGCLDDATLILQDAIDLASGVAENQLAIGALLAVKHEFNRSLNHFDEADRLDPSLLPRTSSFRKFISCFDNLTQKTNKMNSFVEYIRNEVRDFKKLKQQIKRKHEALMHQQIPLNARKFSESTNHKDLLKRGQYCSTRVVSSSEEPVLFCDFYSDMQMRLESTDVDISSLEREIKMTTEAVFNQVNKQIGKEAFMNELNSPDDAEVDDLSDSTNDLKDKSLIWKL